MMHASNEDIERWSTKIREACAKHADYLEPGYDGEQGIQCCARGAVAFDLDDYGNYADEITLDDVLCAIAEVNTSNASQSLIDFLTGVASGFDDQDYYDERHKTEEYETGKALGAEMRAKYVTKVQS